MRQGPSEFNGSNEDMIIDDEVISKMADDFETVLLDMRSEDPRIDSSQVIEKVLVKHFIPFSKRKLYADLLNSRLIERKRNQWETPGIGKPTPEKQSVVEKKEPYDWMIKYRDSGRDNY
ncbi:MAG: hypothetical protein M3Q24_00235 [bacterium]|nr:hypothetical protein [bacterium]